MAKKKKKELESIIENIYKRVKSKRRECIIEGCNEYSINSHILQKNGILDRLSSDNHIVEIKPKSTFSWSETTFENITEFKKVSILKAHSYPTLCNYHDTVIFKEIENHPIDFNSYTTHLLFAFRSLLSIHRKTELAREREVSFLNSRVFKDYYFTNNISNPHINRIESIDRVSKRRYEDYLKFLNDIENQTEEFEFKIFKYPLKDVYASSSGLSYNELEGFYVNVFPYDNLTYTLIFYSKESKDPWISDFINSWENLDEIEFEVRLSTHLIHHCEDWGMSIDLLNTIPIEKQKIIASRNLNSIFNISSLHKDPSFKVDFNIFRN